MAVITLTTDFGSDSHFVAELKGKIATILPQCHVIDITHAIAPFKLTETAFILKNSIFHFPDNSIHAVGVDSNLDVHKAIVVAKHKNQFVVSADNGIVPMVFEGMEFSYKRIEESVNDYFSFKNSFPQYIQLLISNDFDLKKLPGQESGIKQMLNQKPVFNNNIITFNIIYLDIFGNAYTTLTKSFFEEVVGSKKFKLSLSRHDYVDEINTSYTDVGEGDKVCFFDENGYMVIAINRGRADQLLGLKRESSQLVIEIYD